MSGSVLSRLNGATLRQFYAEGHWRDHTIYGVAADWARHAPDRIALRERDREITYAGLVASADAFAADLANRGVSSGQRVALWMPSRIETMIALLACSRDGLVCCPSPHRNHTVGEIVSLMERMRAAALVYQTRFGTDGEEHDITAALDHLGSLRHVYRLDPAGPKTPPFRDLPPHTQERESAGDPDCVTYLAFTSGSTGTPKGVMHSDNTQLVTARKIVADWKLGEDTVIYSMSPMSHNLGVGSFLTCLTAGGTFVIHDLPRGESLVDRLVETGTTYLVGVPTHAIDLLSELDAREPGVLSRIMGFRVSGAAAPPQVMQRLLDHGIPPQSGYGMTETNAHQYTHPGDDAALITGSCGRACDGYEIRIFDPDDPDTELPAGQTGQLGGRGACLMLGYFDDQIATDNAFNADGWFLTGDLGSVDEAGYLRITGRKKEVIIRGGHNINPAKIEALAMKHDAVERAAAIPVADARLGEKVCLAIMQHADRQVEAVDLLAHLAAAGLSKYDMPEFFMAVDDIPLFPNGKIQKLVLQDWLREGRVVPHAVHGDTTAEG